MLLAAPLAFASGISITTPVYGTWWNSDHLSISPGCVAEVKFRLTNTSGFDVTGFTNGFAIYTAESPLGPITNNLFYLAADTLPIGWQTNYMEGVFITRRSWDLIGADTAGFSGFVINKPGIPDGFSEDVWVIRAIPDPESPFGYLCIDTAFFPPGGAWLWSSTNGEIVPDWSGRFCLQVEMCPCGWVVFRDTATVIDVPVNAPFAYTFVATNELNGDDTRFRQLAGPGSLEILNDSTCVWHYTPTPADLGRVDVLKINAMEAAVCATKTVTLTFCQPTLSFGDACPGTELETPVGVTLSHDLAIPCLGYPTFIAGEGGAPPGTCTISGDVLNFAPGSACRGLYTVGVGMTDGADTVLCTIPVLVTDDACGLRGNVDGKIQPEPVVNLADLTYLTAYLFRGGLRPACLEEANVDGQGTVAVADLTYLVAYLFRGGEAPPACP